MQAKNFDPDVKDGLGWTPLMMASSRKDSEAMVELLLPKDANVNETSMSNPIQPEFPCSLTLTAKQDNASQTALHFASSKANLDIARALIEHRASTRTKDRRQQLPIHRAAAVGSVPMLKLLLENRSPINTADVDGMTPLHHGKVCDPYQLNWAYSCSQLFRKATEMQQCFFSSKAPRVTGRTPRASWPSIWLQMQR